MRLEIETALGPSLASSALRPKPCRQILFETGTKDGATTVANDAVGIAQRSGCVDNPVGTRRSKELSSGLDGIESELAIDTSCGKWLVLEVSLRRN